MVDFATEGRARRGGPADVRPAEGAGRDRGRSSPSRSWRSTPTSRASGPRRRRASHDGRDGPPHRAARALEAVRQRPGGRQREPVDRRRDGARARRRERRGQVDGREDGRRGDPRHRRPHAHGRRGGPVRIASRGARPRRGVHRPGAGAGAGHDGGRERVPRRRAAARLVRRPRRDAQPLRRAPGVERLRGARRRPRPVAEHRRPAEGGDPPRAEPRGERDRHGRADRPR